jgi:hypothetical protein
LLLAIFNVPGELIIENIVLRVGTIRLAGRNDFLGERNQRGIMDWEENRGLDVARRERVILSLTTVCTVKRILATLRRRRREERHFALVERF